MAKKNIHKKHSRVFLVVIDASQEQHQAIRFACKRARSTGGRVALFKCLSPAEFQHFAGVAEIMRAEARENAELSFYQNPGYQFERRMRKTFIIKANPQDGVFDTTLHEPLRIDSLSDIFFNFQLYVNVAASFINLPV